MSQSQNDENGDSSGLLNGTSGFNIDAVVGRLLQLTASIAILLVAMIVAFLLYESRTAISQLGFRLWSDDAWFPAETASEGKFGLFPIVVGTLLVSFGAILIAAPVGIASAIFNQFYAPRFIAVVYRRLVELLVGIPSVVFGFWGLVVLCPMLSWLVDCLGRPPIPGPSLLSAVIVVALMILPTVMLMSEAAFRSVPASHLHGAAALGMGRLAAIRHIVLPQAKIGVTTGIVLAMARAIGETMAVVMVAGNIVRIPSSLFDPVRTLTANIALEMGYAAGVQRSALFTSGLLLLGLVAILFIGEIFLRRVVWSRA
ncbi:phosphate ABC transporter permease subunit PstC [Mariniblastus sp.]|nr:phosphate ABC transporter permease subunit PstC [Mariniblastus sp.]